MHASLYVCSLLIPLLSLHAAPAPKNPFTTLNPATGQHEISPGKVALGAVGITAGAAALAGLGYGGYVVYNQYKTGQTMKEFDATNAAVDANGSLNPYLVDFIVNNPGLATSVLNTPAGQQLMAPSPPMQLPQLSTGTSFGTSLGNPYSTGASAWGQTASPFGSSVGSFGTSASPFGAAGGYPVILPSTTAKHTASILFLHGLGDSGHGWSSIAKQWSMQFPYIRFILPHAPTQSVTINAGMKMPSWYDIYSLQDHSKEDVEGMKASSLRIKEWIHAEHAHGIPMHRILIGGFSQGCALALYTALTMDTLLGGCIGLSGYLPLRHTYTHPTTPTLPILLTHGLYDPVIPFSLGEASYHHLHACHYPITFKSYPMQHEASMQEVEDIAQWIHSTLPPL